VTGTPRWRLHRVRPARVEPLEVWDLPCADGAPLHALVGAPHVEDRRARGQSDAAIAEAIAPAIATAIASVHAHEAFLLGGLSALPGLRGAVASHLGGACVLRRHARPELASLEGGAILGGSGALVVDVGQTSIKSWLAGAPDTRATAARAPQDVPPVLVGDQPALDSARRDVLGAVARRWIADVLALAAAHAAAPVLVLGVPFAIDDALVPGSSTYAGVEGDARFVPDVLERVAHQLPRQHAWRDADVDVQLVNDAELAAVAVRDAVTRPPALVLTLGFGPGAARIVAR